MNKVAWALALTAGLMGVGGASQAGLISYQSGGVDLVYDDDYTPVGASNPGLSWAADANLAATTTFGVSGINPNGVMTWAVAQKWIAAMNTAHYAGYNNWRLGSARNSGDAGVCSGENCFLSEMGHLYYIAGSVSQGAEITDSLALTNVFNNLKNAVFWSDTSFASANAWVFNADNGSQFYIVKGTGAYGWPVRPGQVEIAAPPPSRKAPLPGTALLVGLGFGAMSFLRRRKWGPKKMGTKMGTDENGGRGRDRGCPLPPAQIRTSGTTAYGSCLGS